MFLMRIKQLRIVNRYFYQTISLDTATILSGMNSKSEDVWQYWIDLNEVIGMDIG